MFSLKQQSGFALLLVLLITVIVVVAGGAGYYFYKTSQKEKKAEVFEPEQAVDKIAGWKIHRNEKYGFEVKYPAEVKPEEILYSENVERAFCSIGEGCYTSLFSIEFSYSWEELPFQKSPFDMNLDSKDYPICFGRFFVQVIEKPASFYLEILKEKYKKSEYIIIDGVKGLRRNEFKGEPPGGGGNEDVVYLLKNSKLYLIHFIVDREILGNKENMESCLEEQTRTFNQILSTFKFIKVDETAGWKIYKHKIYGYDMLSSEIPILRIIVFDDQNENGIMDSNEKGLQNIHLDESWGDMIYLGGMLTSENGTVNFYEFPLHQKITISLPTRNGQYWGWRTAFEEGWPVTNIEKYEFRVDKMPGETKIIYFGLKRVEESF